MPGGAHENMKAWEPEEDHIIMEMHAAEGPKWKSIVKRLPGRTVRSRSAQRRSPSHHPYYPSPSRAWRRRSQPLAAVVGRHARPSSVSAGREPAAYARVAHGPRSSASHRSPIGRPSARRPSLQVSSVRNRWQRIEKGRKLREEGQELKNRCHACGQPKRGHICYAKMRGGPQVDLPTPPSSAAANDANDGSDDPQMPVPPLPGSLFPGHIQGPPSAGSYAPAGFGHPALRRTRSGSKLVPVEQRAGGPSGYADGAPPPYYGGGGGGHLPSLQRSNTSFFKDLVASDIFSPGSKEMFAAWAESPRDAPASVHAVAADAAAPPSLRRVASSQGGAPEPPKLTRSVTSYLNEIANGGDSGSPLVPNPPGHGVGGSDGSALPPSLAREPSEAAPPMLGRSMTSFVRDFIDESASLDPPPAPPPLQTTASISAFFDASLGATSDAATAAALGPPPTASPAAIAAALGPPPTSSPRGLRNSPRRQASVSSFYS